MEFKSALLQHSMAQAKLQQIEEIEQEIKSLELVNATRVGVSVDIDKFEYVGKYFTAPVKGFNDVEKTSTEQRLRIAPDEETKATIRYINELIAIKGTKMQELKKEFILLSGT